MDDGLNEVYRELFEETNISKEGTTLKYFMNLEYIEFNKKIEVYYGVLNKDV
jgi:ADP-ribose pyrophosphatase YjhB (NUDIX family)